jgi:hypothetical protein
VDDGSVTHHKLVREHEHDIPPSPGSEGRGDTRGSGEREGGPGSREGARSAGSAEAAAGASAGASGTSTGRPVAQLPEEEASAGPAEGKAGGAEEAEGGLRRVGLGHKPLVREVAAVLPLSVQENRGKEERGERPKLRGPEAGRRVVKRHPPSDECSAVGAGGVEGAKGGRRRPHRHVGGAGRCQEGGVGLEGGGEAQASASLCRSGAYVATRAAGRAPMRGLARPSAEVV